MSSGACTEETMCYSLPKVLLALVAANHTQVLPNILQDALHANAYML